MKVCRTFNKKLSNFFLWKWDEYYFINPTSSFTHLAGRKKVAWGDIVVIWDYKEGLSGSQEGSLRLKFNTVFFLSFHFFLSLSQFHFQTFSAPPHFFLLSVYFYYFLSRLSCEEKEESKRKRIWINLVLRQRIIAREGTGPWWVYMKTRRKRWASRILA